MTDKIIRAENIHFAYGSKNVFESLEVNIPRGSIYGLLGPNGCGKSTLLRLIIGQCRPREGEIEVCGVDPGVHYLDIRSRLGLVPQVNDLDPELTVGQTLELFASFYGGRWNPRVAGDKLRRFDLESSRESRVRKLSAGMQQRLSLVTAIAVEPEILLLDEPTAGLDSIVRREFIETVIEYMAEDPGRTVVICSHLLSEIEPLIDHVGLMVALPGGSRMLVESTLRDLKERTLIVEIENSPGALLEHPALLSRGGDDDRVNLILWLDDEQARGSVAREVAESGGRIVDHADLDEVFSRLFRETKPLGQRRVEEGRLHHG